MISMLVIQSYWDIRYKEIPILVTIIGGIVGLTVSFIRQRELIDILLSAIPGVTCLILGRVTREAIGYGDGFLLCSMGMFLSYSVLLSIVMSACILAGVVALTLLVFKRKRGKDQIPFVPFLLVGSVLTYMMEKGIDV